MFQGGLRRSETAELKRLRRRGLRGYRRGGSAVGTILGCSPGSVPEMFPHLSTPSCSEALALSESRLKNPSVVNSTPVRVR